MAENRLKGKTILITGASMGIGEAVARAMAARGANLVLAARSEDRLRALSEELSRNGTLCRYFRCDLTLPEDVARLADQVSKSGFLDGVVHNAGAILYEKFETLSEADERSLFELNFFSILGLTRKLLPLLEKSSSPTLAIVSSAAAWRALPMWSIYCASKAALTSWAEALRLELRPKGIRVVTIYPGVTKTELSAHAKSQGPKPFSTTEGKGTRPEKVAEKIVKAYEEGNRDEYVIFFNRIYRWISFLSPKVLDYFFYKYYQRKGWL
jgi:short-subunit dehydrogenase